MGEARLSTEWIRTPIITAAAVLGLFLCYLLTLPFLSSLTWAFVLSVVFLPMHRRIEGLTRQYNSLAAAVSVSMAMIVVLVPLALVGQQIVREAANGSVHLAGVLRTAEWREAIAAYPRLAEIVVWIEKQLDLAEVVSNLAAWLSSLSTSLLRGSVSQGINFVLTYYLLFYFLRDRDRAFLVIRSLSPLNPTEAKEVARRVVDTVQATVFGTLAVAAIQGTLGGLMFWWLALPTPVFWGVVMGLLAIVPVLGAFVVWIPAAIFLALEGEWLKALMLAGWGGLIVATVDNLLYPVLVGNRLRLHTVVALIGAIGGIIVFGAPGLVLGPATIAVTLVLIEILRCRFGDKALEQNNMTLPEE